MKVPSSYTPRVHASISEIGTAEWNALAGDQPFLRHEFLHALEESGCVAERTGWEPQHLALWQGRRLAAAIPLYVKSHSYGEYVFDWAWAEAHHRVGVSYYPKLLSSVPFTPVTGKRLLACDDAARVALAHCLVKVANESDMSSLHVLFPQEEDAAALVELGLHARHGVQFHWCNPGYADFDDFLASLARDKRKKIRQERRRIAEAGVEFRILEGSEIKSSDWAFFHRCYQRTYRMHASTPYLNRDFFLRIGSALAPHLLLIVAERGGRPIASAFNVFNGSALYGRYWGAVEDIPLLHFETCYYRAIDFCIARGIPLFEGGAQGEHKLARGFLPVRTTSCHWLRDSRFDRAVSRYLERETGGVELYIDELNEHSPFRAEN